MNQISVRKNSKKILVLITKEVERINKNGKEITKIIPYKLQFIGSPRFMASVVDNPPEGVNDIIIFFNGIIKNAKRVELNANIVSTALNMHTINMI